jgi:nucleoside-diphosphate-sugar epimerase
MNGAPPTVVVTGAGGFIGRHLVRALIGSAAGKIRAIVGPAPASPFAPHRNLTVVQGDLRERAVLEGALVAECMVVHLAYVAEAAHDNLVVTDNLIRAARTAGAARVVHCSTAVVVGPGGPRRVDENTPARPAKRGYPSTKLEIEGRLVRGLLPDVELAILRPTHVFGPGGAGLTPMIARLRAGKPRRVALRRLLLGNRRVNYVSVHNVVDAIEALIATGEPQRGDVYYVSDDKDQDNRYGRIEDILREALGLGCAPLARLALPAALVSLILSLLPSHAPSGRVYSTARLEALGYAPRTSLRAAVRELVATCGGSAAED